MVVDPRPVKLRLAVPKLEGANGKGSPLLTRTEMTLGGHWTRGVVKKGAGKIKKRQMTKR